MGCNAWVQEDSSRTVVLLLVVLGDVGEVVEPDVVGGEVDVLGEVGEIGPLPRGATEAANTDRSFNLTELCAMDPCAARVK